MEKVRPWYGQPSDRGRLKNRTEQPHVTVVTITTLFNAPKIAAQLSAAVAASIVKPRFHAVSCPLWTSLQPRTADMSAKK